MKKSILNAIAAMLAVLMFAAPVTALAEGEESAPAVEVKQEVKEQKTEEKAEANSGEKAETKAVGRALAMLGYGTQFAADELDEGERIADTPIDRTPKPAQKPVQPAQKAQPKPANTGSAKLATPEQKKMLRDVINLEQLAACNKMYGEDWGTMTANQCATMYNKIMRQQNGEAR